MSINLVDSPLVSLGLAVTAGLFLITRRSDHPLQIGHRAGNVLVLVLVAIGLVVFVYTATPYYKESGLRTTVESQEGTW